MSTSIAYTEAILAIRQQIADVDARVGIVEDTGVLYELGQHRAALLRQLDELYREETKPKPIQRISFRDHVGKGNRPHIRPATPEAMPMPVFAFVREEGLVTRLAGALVWDPCPTGYAMAELLPKAIPGLAGVIHYPGKSWTSYMPPKATQLPSRIIISSPERKTFHKLTTSAIAAGAEYIAVFVDMSQLAGRRRWDELYQSRPPQRVYVLAESWTATTATKAGSGGAWRPGIWIVWDGAGGPIDSMPVAPPELRWIPDSSHRP